MGCYQFYNHKNPMEDKIQRLVNAANSTNATAKEMGTKGLRELGLDNNGNPLKSASTKAAKPKAERKKREPKPKAEVKSGTPYDCDDLIAKAEERKAKAKANAIKRANEPKKTDATKNKEAIEKAATRVEKNVEKRVKKDEISFGEIKKLIAEYEDAIAKLKVLLAKAEGKMAKGGGVNAEEVEHILMKAQGVKEHHCGCGGSKMATGGGLGNIGNAYSFDVTAKKSNGSEVKQVKTAYAENENLAKQNLLKFLSEKLHYTNIKISNGRTGHEGVPKLNYAKGGGVGESEEVYIEFMNKDKGFKVDRKSFKSYEEAKKWASKNFERFDPDMIKYK